MGNSGGTFSPATNGKGNRTAPTDAVNAQNGKGSNAVINFDDEQDSFVNAMKGALV